MYTSIGVKEWFIIRILKNVLLILYYSVPVYLSLEVINEWVVDIQESLTRKSEYFTWAPTGPSYILLSATILFILWAIFGWFHFLLAVKDSRDIIPGFMAALVFAFGCTFTLPIFLLSTPFAFDNYVAADEDGFYHDPFFGFEVEMYPWEESQVILGYQYDLSTKIGINYIIKSREKEYDLGESMINEMPSERQLQMLKDVDRIAREKGVPFTIRYQIGRKELESLRSDARLTKEDFEFMKQMFRVENQ